MLKTDCTSHLRWNKRKLRTARCKGSQKAITQLSPFLQCQSLITKGRTSLRRLWVRDGRSRQQLTKTCSVADLKGDLDNYFSRLKETKVKSLQELVDWNRANADEALTEGIVSPSTVPNGLLNYKLNNLSKISWKEASLLGTLQRLARSHLPTLLRLQQILKRWW